MKKIVLLGSTGSVGRNVLDIVRRYPDRFSVLAMASNRNASLFSSQLAEFAPDEAVIADERSYLDVKGSVPGRTSVSAGAKEVVRLAALEDADLVFISISGSDALLPLLAAVKAAKTVALASKEPMVSAGEIIMRTALKSGSDIIPVDSEHSAILNCLEGRSKEDVERLYITGTGGSLLERSDEDFSGVSVDDVLSHPKWDMGRKITVDSATLMNKGLEVIEARWFFDIPPERIKVIIHPEAIIHSMVEFIDGTIRAGLFFPDMRFPILRALSYPDIVKSDLPRVDFSASGKLTFREPDRKRFLALDLAYGAIREGGTMPAVMNMANEAAVSRFLKGEIRFDQIIEKVEKVMRKHKKSNDPSLENIMEAGKWAFEEVLES
jgi:1-deoxy-D-xylulose-5-phosphate reductoisomerase